MCYQGGLVLSTRYEVAIIKDKHVEIFYEMVGLLSQEGLGHKLMDLVYLVHCLRRRAANRVPQVYILNANVNEGIRTNPHSCD